MLFVATEEDEGIRFTLTYATSLFTAETIERMPAKHRISMDTITADVNVVLKDIQFITDDDAALYEDKSNFQDVIDADFFF